MILILIFDFDLDIDYGVSPSSAVDGALRKMKRFCSVLPRACVELGIQCIGTQHQIVTKNKLSFGSISVTYRRKCETFMTELSGGSVRVHQDKDGLTVNVHVMELLVSKLSSSTIFRMDWFL